jgi:very-short-patch-repair endonuclease
LKPNKKEESLATFLEGLYPHKWKYVGDGQLILGGRCPDFLNINGKKQLIELFGDYFHKGQNPQDRIDYFTKYGFSTLVIWEHELKQPEVLKEKIIEFVG